MGIITGYISLISFLLICFKYIARRVKNEKLNLLFATWHKPLSCIFLISAVVHFVLIIPVLMTRSWEVITSGVVIVLLSMTLITLCHLDKSLKRKVKVHRWMTFIMIVAVALHVIFYYVDFCNYQESIRNIHLDGINLANTENGTYIGEYNAGYIYAKVSVIVDDHVMTDIQILEHRNERGALAETITNAIKDEQTTLIDAVSGATNSSLVIRKALENAIGQ